MYFMQKGCKLHVKIKLFHSQCSLYKKLMPQHRGINY